MFTFRPRISSNGRYVNTITVYRNFSTRMKIRYTHSDEAVTESWGHTMMVRNITRKKSKKGTKRKWNKSEIRPSLCILYHCHILYIIQNNQNNQLCTDLTSAFRIDILSDASGSGTYKSLPSRPGRSMASSISSSLIIFMNE